MLATRAAWGLFVCALVGAWGLVAIVNPDEIGRRALSWTTVMLTVLPILFQTAMYAGCRISTLGNDPVWNGLSVESRMRICSPIVSMGILCFAGALLGLGISLVGWDRDSEVFQFLYVAFLVAIGFLGFRDCLRRNADERRAYAERSRP